MQLGDGQRVGTTLAGYRLDALLGGGGLGAVYRAEDLRRGRRVALRILTRELAADERFREQVLRESMLVASLEHPGIVPVHEAGEADGQVFVAMALAEGLSLADLLAWDGRLEPAQALRVVTQVAEALDTARWGRGLVHGSLSPERVFVLHEPAAGPGGRALLGGFGLRRELSSGAAKGQAAGLGEAAGRLGPPGYLAPEQIDGRPVSPRSDVYALGCMLFECLTGGPPFGRDPPEAVPQAHLHEPPPSASRACPGLSAAIDRVLARALAKWPEERYSTCAELAAAAEAALFGGAERHEEAPVGTRRAPVAVPALRERVPEQPPSAAATERSEAPASPSLARRLGAARGKAVAAIAAVAAVAAVALVVAGVVWPGGDTDEMGFPAPATSASGVPNQAALPAGAAPAEASVQPEEPADAEPAGESAVEPVLSRLPGSLVRVDAATGEILARLAIPFPRLLAADRRSVWVLSDEGERTTLVRVEGATNALAEVFSAEVGGGLAGRARRAGAARRGGRPRLARRRARASLSLRSRCDQR